MKGIKEGKCLRKPNIFVADTYAPSAREKVQCQVNALAKASSMNGFTNEWKEYEPKFKQQFDAWKQCDSLDGKLKKIL